LLWDGEGFPEIALDCNLKLVKWQWTHMHRESGLLILMTLLSVGLAVIQYRWTGELSQ
jgi:hypothetical protein